MIELTSDPVMPASSGPTIISDVEPFQVPGSGEWLPSRSAVRRFERENEGKQCGNDWTGSSKPAFWDEMVAENRER